jgi:hypothetical protein
MGDKSKSDVKSNPAIPHRTPLNTPDSLAGASTILDSSAKRPTIASPPSLGDTSAPSFGPTRTFSDQALKPTQSPARMDTPKSISSESPPKPKRLRLGTRSCAECRRRKVRCIFPPNNKTCQGCAAHEILCISQQSADVQKVRPYQDVGPNAKQQLERLEGVVLRLCEVMDLKMESLDPSQLEMSVSEAMKKLRSASEPETHLNNVNWLDTPESEDHTPSSNAFDAFEDAPLINLFHEAMLIQKRHFPEDTNQTDRSADNRARIVIKSLRTLLPNSDAIDSILKLTEQYWPIWDGHGLVFSADRSHLINTASAKSFIVNSLRSENLLVVAKCILFLAMCIQQLPKDFKISGVHLPECPNALVDSYMDRVDNLLSLNGSHSISTEVLECLEIQSKIYINMGKPRESWQCCRRGIDLATLLGLHKVDDTSSDHQKAIWSHFWQGDRHLSLILGLPAATTDLHLGISKQHAGPYIGSQIMYDLAILAGQIIERNQNHQIADYSTTLKIDQQLQECYRRIPLEYWNTVPNPSISLGEAYMIQVIRLHYYNTAKLLHLPYLFLSLHNKAYEYNRLSALEACRDVIRSYQVLRSNSGMALLICDLMDFQVCSGALVLIINLLSHPSQLTLEQAASDWDLIHRVKGYQKYLAEGIECRIATQAAQLLDYLSTLHDGTYTGPEYYEAVIPLFGRLRISHPRRPPLQNELVSVQDRHFLPQPQFSESVEFSTNSLGPFDMNSTGDYLPEAELGADWTSNFDVDNYDWNQVFDGTGVAGY